MTSSIDPVRRLVSTSLALSILGCGGGGGGTASASSSPSVPSSPSPSSGLYPSYNISPLAADASGMGDTATQIASRLKLGFNIGNTLEAIGGSETAWGNPRITAEFVQCVKRAGFRAIRLPVAWDQYADAKTARIDPAWLDRVQQVVQYCLDADLVTIVNIHWDKGWLENNVSPDQQDAVNAKQRAFWEQIATRLRGFDGRLLFASANEPNAKTDVQMKVLLSYHQTFIDAVRSTGGRNAYRNLIVQGPSTDIETTSKLMTRLPTDKASQRLMVEVHYYTPWNFTGMTQDESWGNQFFYWGRANHSTTDTAHNPTWGEEATIDTLFGLMKAQFIDKGIPVIVGEFGAIKRTTLTGDALKLHLASRAAYFKSVAQKANAMGLNPFYWDTGDLLDRKLNTIRDSQALNALLQGAGLSS